MNNPPYKVPCRSSFGAKGCLHPRPEHPSTTHKSSYFTAPRLAFKSKPKPLRPSNVRPCALAGRHMATILVFYGILRSAMKSQSRTLATSGPSTSDPVACLGSISRPWRLLHELQASRQRPCTLAASPVLQRCSIGGGALSGDSPAYGSAANACLAIQTLTSAPSLAAATLTLCVPRQGEAKSIQNELGNAHFCEGF